MEHLLLDAGCPSAHRDLKEDSKISLRHSAFVPTCLLHSTKQALGKAKRSGGGVKGG
jgi:hypothetical protein